MRLINVVANGRVDRGAVQDSPDRVDHSARRARVANPVYTGVRSRDAFASFVSRPMAIATNK